jgi:hypothetical protein
MRYISRHDFGGSGRISRTHLQPEFLERSSRAAAPHSRFQSRHATRLEQRTGLHRHEHIHTISPHFSHGSSLSLLIQIQFIIIATDYLSISDRVIGFHTIAASCTVFLFHHSFRRAAFYLSSASAYY